VVHAMYLIVSLLQLVEVGGSLPADASTALLVRFTQVGAEIDCLFVCGLNPDPCTELRLGLGWRQVVEGQCVFGGVDTQAVSMPSEAQQAQFSPRLTVMFHTHSPQYLPTLPSLPSSLQADDDAACRLRSAPGWLNAGAANMPHPQTTRAIHLLTLALSPPHPLSSSLPAGRGSCCVQVAVSTRLAERRSSQAWLSTKSQLDQAHEASSSSPPCPHTPHTLPPTTQRSTQLLMSLCLTCVAPPPPYLPAG
jgi:hypothetical protein